MDRWEYLKQELTALTRATGENAESIRKEMRAAVDALVQTLLDNGQRDEALVELAGMMDEALTCMNEQNAALVELAAVIAEGNGD